MNKTLLLTGVATTMFAFSANAMDFSQYVSAKLSYGNESYDVKTGDTSGYRNEFDYDDNVFGGSLAYGVKVGPVRTELELSLKEDAEKKRVSLSQDEGTVKRTLENKLAMLNAYYDINTGTKFTPYIGAGIGMARLKTTVRSADESYDKSKTNFAWQVGAGIAYALTDNVSIDLGYRYIDEGKLTYRDSTGFNTWDVKAQEALLGVRYSF